MIRTSQPNMYAGIWVLCLTLLGCQDRRQSPADESETVSAPYPSVTSPGTNVQTEPLLIEACLIYGTQSSMPPTATYRPVDPELRAKLKKMPLRLTNQFVVSKTRLSAPWTVEQTRSLSTNYQIRIRCLNGDKFDLTVIRQGKMVIRRTQRITKDEICVVGGDFPSSLSSWLIVLWQVQ